MNWLNHPSKLSNQAVIRAAQEGYAIHKHSLQSLFDFFGLLGFEYRRYDFV